jgi:hypothetical protein
VVATPARVAAAKGTNGVVDPETKQRAILARALEKARRLDEARRLRLLGDAAMDRVILLGDLNERFDGLEFAIHAFPNLAEEFDLVMAEVDDAADIKVLSRVIRAADRIRTVALADPAAE